MSATSKHVFGALIGTALNSSARRRFVAPFIGAVLLGLLPALPSSSAVPVQVATTLTAGGGWLDRFNLWRANAGQSSLIENSTWSGGDYNHAQYMVRNNLITHYETVGVPYYSPAGDTAAQNSNIFVSSSTSTADEQAIDWWMGAPFHAMAMMDPRLTTTGFGSYRDSTASPWQMGAAVDVGRGMLATGRYPVYFPGNLSTEPLTTFSGNETPDPLQACPGYSGLPVFVEVGSNVNTAAGTIHTFTGNGVALDNCVIDSTNPTFTSYLKWRGGVIMMPRQPLQTGVTYTVALTVNAVPYTWSFTVGPLTVPPPPAGWQSLGGVLTSGPGVSTWGATRVDAFARGSDNSLFQNTWNGTAWGGWISLGGVLTANPGAVSWSANRIDAFARGSDNQLYHKFWDGTRWSAWEALGGILTSGPAAASWAAGRLDVFVRGTDSALWHKWWDGTQWSGWQNLSGILTSDPGAVSSAANRVDVVVRGTDNAVWIRSWNGSGWTPWTNLGGIGTSAPAIASCASGHLDIFVRGSDTGLYQLGLNGTSWTGWKALGGTWTSGPSAVCRPGTSSIDLFARFADNALWMESVAGS
jgi:uncharacterized protein YkwD